MAGGECNGRGETKSVQLVAVFSQSGLFSFKPSQVPPWILRPAALGPVVYTNMAIRTAVDLVWATHTLQGKRKKG